MTDAEWLDEVEAGWKAKYPGDWIPAHLRHVPRLIALARKGVELEADKSVIDSGPTIYWCPVCGGRGQVATGFYVVHQPLPDSIGGTASSTPLMEPCRSCAGVGVIWR